MHDSTSSAEVIDSQAGCTEAPSETIVLIPTSSSATDDRQLLNSCIAAVNKSFESLNRQHEIVLLLTEEDSASDDQLQALGVREVMRGTLAQALARLTTSVATQIVVVDPEIQLNETQLKWLAESGTNADLACFFLKQRTSGTWRTRIAQSFVALTTKLALHTGKHDGRPGVVICNAPALQPLLTENVDFESAAELIALCRADGYSIFEAQLASPHFQTTQADSLRTQAKRVARTARFWWNNIAFPSTKHDPQLASSPSSKISARTHWLAATMLVAIAASILFSNLNYALLEPDEARNAQLGLNIFQTGDWMSLTLSQENYWDKPPLQAWMTAASYHLLGPSEFATRLPCAAATMLTILTILLLGSKVFDEQTGFCGAVILLLSSGFLLSGRYVTMDASLTCLATIMFLAIVLGFRAGRHTKLYLLVAGIACGLGILTKGPVIGVLVLPPVVLAGWLEQNRMMLNLRSWLFIAVPAVLISAPWFLATAIVHPDFLYYFFWKHNVARFSNAFNHQQPWWYYLPVLMLMMYPACFLFPIFFKTLIASRRSQKPELGAHFGKLLLYVLWVVGFFSMSESKLPTYIIPGLPVLCLLLGRILVLAVGPVSLSFAAGKWLTSITRHMSFSVGVMLMVLVGAMLFVFPSSVDTTLACIALGLLAVLIFVFVRRIRALDNNRIGLGAVAVAGLLFVSLLVTQLLPKIAESRSFQTAITDLTETSMYDDSPIVFMGRPPLGNSFWLPGRQVFHFSDDQEMDALIYLMNQPKAILVASNSHIEALQRNLIGAEFRKEQGHRKLYTMRPKSSVVAPSLEAGRTLPVRVSRLPFSGR